MQRYRYRFELRSLISLGSTPYLLPVNCWRATFYLTGMDQGVLVNGQRLFEDLELDPVNRIGGLIKVDLGGVRDLDGAPVMIDQQLNITNDSGGTVNLRGVLKLEYLEPVEA